MPHGSFPPPYGAPPRQPRTGLIVGLSIGGAIILAGAAVTTAVLVSGGDPESTTAAAGAATSSAPPPASTPPPAPEAAKRRITVPGSISGYSRQSGNLARRVTGEMRKGMVKEGLAKSATKKIKVALYTGRGQLAFMGYNRDEIPGENHASPSATVDGTLLGTGIGDTTDNPAGPNGGVLRCGKAKSGGVTTAACAWADASVVGVLAAPDLSPKALAAVALKFRKAAER